MESISFPDLFIVVVGLANLSCLIVKFAFLFWVYVRTQKLAAMVYGVFLLIAGLVPFILPRLLTARDFGTIWLFLNAGTAFVEVGLFIWLVRSLIKRPTPSSLLPTDA